MARPSDQALVSDQAAARLDPSGFDPSREWMAAHELQSLMRARFAARGTATKFANGTGICDETILSFLRGARLPADDLLAALGWERQIFYRRVGSCQCYRCTTERVRSEPQNGGVFGDLRLLRMFLCETCGNKRCPHAADHRLNCTGSNDPGQAGSLYENAPTFRDRDAAPRGRAAAEAEGQQPGPQGIAEANPSPSPPGHIKPDGANRGAEANATGTDHGGAGQ